MRNIRGFVSGSMKLTDMPKPQQIEIHQKLNHILDGMIKKNHQILIGDSYSGTDHNTIQYLDRKNYHNVVIGSTTKTPRDFIAKRKIEHGEWQNAYHQGDPSNHVAKDIDLADHADYGIGVINPTYKTKYGNDRVSQGTLRNMIQLVSQKKPAALIYYQNSQIHQHRLNNIQDLDQAIQSMHNPLVSQKYQTVKTNELKRLDQSKINPKSKPHENDGPEP